MEKEKKMVFEKSWKQFRESGLLWWTNRILHLFGWAIVFEFEDKKIIRVYPARVKFRGFDYESEENGFKNVSNYLKRTSKILRKECDD